LQVKYWGEGSPCVDYCSMVFVLSAVAPHKMRQVGRWVVVGGCLGQQLGGFGGSSSSSSSLHLWHCKVRVGLPVELSTSSALPCCLFMETSGRPCATWLLC
jgi:hypothetical protein